MDTAKQLRDAVRYLLVAHGALEDARRPCGAPMALPRAYALLELLRHGPMTVSALAERLSIDRTNVSRLCARMEEEGELVRAIDPEDARARVLGLTARGKRVARSVDATSAQHFEQVLGRLGDDGERVLDALRLLHRALVSTATEPAGETNDR